MAIRLFGASETPDWNHHRPFLEPLVQHGAAHFVRNADNEVRLLQLGEYMLPVVLGNPKRRRLSYVASLTSQYIDYAVDDIRRNDKYSRLLKYGVGLYAGVMSAFCSTLRFDKTALVNDWLFSTNLYPALDLNLLPQTLESLVKAFPDRAIVFKSVVDGHEEALLDALTQLGFLPVVSRQMYLIHPDEKTLRKKRPFQMDRKMWEKNTRFAWRDEVDVPAYATRLLELYRGLYLDKYSSLNPDYTEAFIRAAYEAHILHFQLLWEGESIIGVQAVLEQNKVLTTPFIGHDRNIPQETGLYRMINLRLIEEAISRNFLLNMSSGAGVYKKQRGGVTAYEYNLVYTKHLSPARRWPFQFYHYIGERYVKPGMQRYEI